MSKDDERSCLFPQYYYIWQVIYFSMMRAHFTVNYKRQHTVLQTQKKITLVATLQLTRSECTAILYILYKKKNLMQNGFTKPITFHVLPT